jgi:ParB-like chromosome segregation protein Spo0J
MSSQDDDEDDLDFAQDEDGHRRLALVTNQSGRSALDLAEDAECTQEELQAGVEEERTTLSSYHGYRYNGL